MSEIGLLVTAGIYLLTAYDQMTRGNAGMALAFLSYATANMGLLWAVK